MMDIKIDKCSFVKICKNRKPSFISTPLTIHIGDILEDYDFKKELGSGTYGIVYEAVHLTTGTLLS